MVEEELKVMTENDRRNTQKMRDLYDQHQQDITNMTKQTEIDIRKLVSNKGLKLSHSTDFKKFLQIRKRF